MTPTPRPFRPVRVLDVELAEPPADLTGLAGYGAVRCLLRLRGVPVGHVELPVTHGRVSAHAVREAALSHAGNAVAARHLHAALSRPDPDAPWTPQAVIDTPPQDGLWDERLGPPPTVTVAVCTRERPDDLRLCLRALVELDYPNLDLLVVDNAPTSDATERVVREYAPRVRYVREDRPGLDWARNRAALEARGEIVAYTDDDVVVDSGWAAAIAAVFAENSGVMCVTGLVVPYELDTPAQVTFETYGGFGRGYERRWYGVDLPGGERAGFTMSGAGKFGTGANMAYRRELFDRIGFFDPALDVGTVTNGGGDLEMFFRTVRFGFGLVYEPRAIVRHRHRRDDEKLRTQIANNGVGFYSHLVRSALNAPHERAGIARLGAWWFGEWSVKRFVKSFVRPPAVPRELITAELVGSVRGLGRYAQARRTARALAREGDPVDAPRVPVAWPEGARRGAVAVRHIHIDDGVPALEDVSAYAATHVVVFRRGRPVASLDVSNVYAPLSATRLRDELVRHLGTRLLDRGVGATHHDLDRELMALVRTRYGHPAPTALPEHTPVSILVCTRDRPDDLRGTLAGLAGQITSRDVEIVVVDNHPASGLTAPVVADFPGVRLVAEPRPGSSYARNAGLRVCRGEIVAVTDDDVTVPPDWLEAVVAPFAREDVGIVTGNVLPSELETASQQMFEHYGGLGRGFERREYDLAWFRSFRRKGVPTWFIGATANAAFRASLFRDPRVGLMEEALGAGMPAGVGEDTYTFYRALRAGYTVVYEPSAYVSHRHRRTMKALRGQIAAYSRGHVAYHLLTFVRDRDVRGLIHVAAAMPYWRARQFAAWLRDAPRGRARYPLPLMLLETWNNLLGPVALWQSLRRVRQIGRSEPLAARPDVPAEQAAPEAVGSVA